MSIIIRELSLSKQEFLNEALSRSVPSEPKYYVDEYVRAPAILKNFKEYSHSASSGLFAEDSAQNFSIIVNNGDCWELWISCVPEDADIATQMIDKLKKQDGFIQITTKSVAIGSIVLRKKP